MPGPASSVQIGEERPFPGLRPFDFEDARFFFGRERQVATLFRYLDRSRFIAVIGSSGSGKSSLVRAGLLPLLAKEASEQGGRPWRWAPMTPGDAPVARLARALSSLATPAPDERPSAARIRYERVEAALRRSSFGIAEALDEIPDARTTPILLVVDQFEELFRHAAGGLRDTVTDERLRAEAADFVQLLLEASRSRECSVHVLITMRSDFIGDCAQFYGLPEAVSTMQYLVPGLTRDQRADVIRKPVSHVGGTIEPELVERLLNDAGGEMDELPVLQHCLLRLWEAARAIGGSPHITLEHYANVGRIRGALSQHANEVMATLPGLFDAVEKVFRALSERDREGRATRRALPFHQLLAETGVADAQLRSVLERFRADDCTFLVPSVLAEPELRSETRIDVAHEALLRRWDQISGGDNDKIGPGNRGWLFAEERDGQMYSNLRGLVETHNDVTRTVTLPAALTDERWHWWEELHPTPAWADRYGGNYARVERLLLDSRSALDRDRARQAETEERERDFAVREAAAERERLENAAAMERLRADGAHQVARTTRRYLLAAVVLFILALVGLGAAVVNANTARENANTARETVQRLANVIDAESSADSVTMNASAADYVKVIAAYTAVIRLTPKDAVAYVKRGYAYEQRSKYDEAFADFSEAIHLQPSNALAYRDRGDVLADRNKPDLDRAIRDENQALNLDPEMALAYISRGLAYKAKSNFSAALSDDDQAVRLDPKLAIGYLNRGIIYRKQGDTSRALQEFAVAIKLAPTLTNTYSQRGFLETDQQDYAGAIRDDQTVARLQPTAQNFENLCIDYLDHQDAELALAACNRAIKLDPKFPNSYVDRGVAYSQKDQYAADLADLDTAIRLAPKNALAYHNRAAAYAQLGEESRAVPDRAKAHQLDPKRY